MADPVNPDGTGTPVEGGTPPADGGTPPDDGGTPPADGEYGEFTVPEGMEVDTALLEQAVPLFKEMGLTQEQAQKLIDLQSTNVQAQQDAVAAQIESWEAACKNDKEIGGDGFDENIGLGKLALEKLGTPELRDFLTESGAGSHPEIVRMLVRMGKLMKEDNPGSAGGSPPEQKTMTERWYKK